MPKLFHLVSAYAQHAIAPSRPPSPPMPLNRTIPTTLLHTKDVRQIETVAVILMNVAQIALQMVPDRTLAKQLVNEGAVDSLMCLCVYFPNGVRTRALDDAIRATSMDRNRLVDSSGDIAMLRWKKAQVESSVDSHSQHPPQKQMYQEGDEFEEGSLISMDDAFHAQLESLQGLAAKCMSIIAADVTNQAFIVDDPDRIDRLTQLLYSNNAIVVKYACKTMAYLSLRNDRYKPDIVKGSGAAALLAVLQAAIGDHARSGGSELVEAISHACCALANLATNTESQEILMSHMELLNATCAVVGLFPHQREIERHVARLLANLALYDQNKLALLTAYSSPSDSASVDGYGDSQIGLNKQPHRSTTPIRFPSPPPPARRAKGNVIPTLVNIGAMTLERAYPTKDEEYRKPYQQHDQDAVDFMNDEDQQLSSVDAGYLTPNDSSSENDVSGRGFMRHTLAETIDKEGDEQTPEWVTVQGMEDVQRHIIRAIDNLMTSVTEDPSSSQSFKVFSRVWPTIGLIKTIQMANQDEDTQRRALHVLSTLIQLQEIHADAMVVVKQQIFGIEQSSQLDTHSTNSQQQQCKDDELEKSMYQNLGENSTAGELAEEQAGKECLEKARKGKMETEKLEQGILHKERSEDQCEQERLQKGYPEIELLEREGLEKEAESIEGLGHDCHDQERIRNEGKGQEPHNQEKLELEETRLRNEQACLEQMRLKHDQAEQAEQDEGALVSSASSLRVPSPTIVSGLEEQTTSQDEEPLPREKTKKKKKRSSK
ncbi:hypothetical protein BGZ58_009193 [Dissophora ornata]|nr:hypothetical protein BGZ58_009193 [Dissophora ornata]